MFQDIHAAHLDNLLWKCTPRERRSIEIDEKDNFGDSVIDIFPRKITNTKTNYDGNGLHLLSILKSPRLPRAIFQRDHLGPLQCKNPVYITCFSRALETEKKGFSGEIFHTIRMNIVWSVKYFLIWSN